MKVDSLILAMLPSRKNTLISKKKKKTQYGRWHNLVLMSNKICKNHKKMSLNYTRK